MKISESEWDFFPGYLHVDFTRIYIIKSPTITDEAEKTLVEHLVSPVFIFYSLSIADKINTTPKKQDNQILI